jgi:hypothetical protein
MLLTHNGERVCCFAFVVLLGPAFELLYSTLPNGIVAVETSPPATSPMSSTRFKGTMLMGGLASTIDDPVLASARRATRPIVSPPVQQNQVTFNFPPRTGAELLMGDTYFKKPTELLRQTAQVVSCGPV